MSTPATIIVKVKKEDIGSVRKCNVADINLRTEKMFIESYIKIFGEEKGSEIALNYIHAGSDKVPNKEEFVSKIEPVELGNFIEIYHHWDGFPDSLGDELLKHFNTYESALNLMLGGDVSTIVDGSVPYISVGRPWEESKPTILDEVTDCTMNYQYLFKNGKWYYRTFSNKKFKRLI